jgi:hypothetical protein
LERHFRDEKDNCKEDEEEDRRKEKEQARVLIKLGVPGDRGRVPTLKVIVPRY